jgi:hypothetical protein
MSWPLLQLLEMSALAVVHFSIAHCSFGGVCEHALIPE